MKPLAVLKHHREGLYCLDVAQIQELVTTAVSPTGLTATIDEVEAKEDGRQENNTKQLQDTTTEDGSDRGSESEDDSEEEEAFADRHLWSKRHWIAASGKESRISLWEIY